MKTVKTHHDLEVWKRSLEFVVNLYVITEKFPSGEKFGLISQIRRAGFSIPSNIAEGASRNSPKEFRYFIAVALGSATEIETQLEIAIRLGFLKSIKTEMESLTCIRKMLINLRKSLEIRIETLKPK
jgi:four helix bundle protein